MKVIRRTREEVIKRWVAALRSGKYKQTTGELREGGRYCCLGVLCDLAAQDGGEGWTGEKVYAGQDGMPPSHMQAFIRDGRDWSLTRLSEMNDDGASFDVIADEIEKVLL